MELVVEARVGEQHLTSVSVPLREAEKVLGSPWGRQ